MPQTFTYRLRCGTFRTEADMSGIWHARSDVANTEEFKRVRVQDRTQTVEVEALDTDKSPRVKDSEARTTRWSPHALAEYYRSNQDASSSRIGECVPKDTSWSPHSLRKHFDFIESTTQRVRKPAKAETRKAVELPSKG